VKARRAIVELGLHGSWYMATGLVALGHAAGHGAPDFGALAAVLGVLVGVTVIYVIGLAVYRLREIEGLPETARRLSWPSIAARVALSSGAPVGLIFLLSSASSDAGWLFGLTYAVLGAAIWAIAVLAGHVEHLCGARVWRSNHRFYFAR
jgi:hypothetical protein